MFGSFTELDYREEMVLDVLLSQFHLRNFVQVVLNECLLDLSSDLQ